MPISSMPLPGDEEPPDSSSQIAWLRSLQDREALFQIMEGDRRTAESLEAAEALAGLGDVRGLDHLIATLNDPRSGLRLEAAEILQQLGHPRGMRALESNQAETQSSRRAGEREETYDDLNAATTDELVAIWHENNRAEWSDLEFEVIETILTERLGRLPRRDGEPADREGVDEEVDPRIQAMWRAGEVDSLMRILRQEPDVRLRMEAAEGLAAMGDDSALDFLIDMLDEGDEKSSDMAAAMLDWLDLPPGKAALLERGYVFDTDESGVVVARPATPPSTGASAAEARSQVTKQARTEEDQGEPKASSSFAKPLAPATSGRQGSDGASGTSFSALVTGAAGGVLGFLAVSLGMDFLGARPLPGELAGWLEPSIVYSLIEALVIGGLAGSIGRRVAMAMAARAGDDLEDQDARLTLGALASGAAFSAVAVALRFVLGG